jgi:hypothetical protein
MNRPAKSTAHERFSEMSALFAGGQLPPEEYAEWRAHLAECSACRTEYDGFAKVSSGCLPFLHEGEASSSWITDSRIARLATGAGYEARFLARARTQGHPFAVPAESAEERTALKRREARELFAPLPAYAIAMFVLLIVVIGSLMYRVRLTESESRGHLNEIAKLNEQVTTLNQQMSSLYGVSQQAHHQLSESEARSAELSSRRDTLAAQLTAASAQVRSLLSEAADYENNEADIAARLQQSQQTIDQLTAELKATRDLRAHDAATIKEQETRLAQAQPQMDEIARRYSAEFEAIRKEKSLLAADRDIRELMGARNLHIVDVFDVDGKGRTQRPFGRVFYTEGKSLIFYAFDLAGGKRPALVNASYQAWGSQEANERQAQSLGVFYQDDKAQNRWALKFDDPSVLAAIDYVFVTVEPSGGSKAPSSHKVLYAYLNTQPNHP